MFWLRLALIFLALWLVLVSGSSEEYVHLDPKIQKQKKMLKERRAICFKGPSYGSCKGKRKMWNYNFRRDQCELFTFSNCGGNRNRFHTQEACLSFCNKEHWKVPDLYSN